MTGYLTFKTIHVLAAIVFVGNIVVTGVWKGLADRTRSREVITFAQRLVTITDYLFTGGGAVVVLMTGLLMMRSYERTVLEIPWLFWGIALFAVSGTIWLAALVPIQRKQIRLLRESGEGIPDADTLVGLHESPHELVPDRAVHDDPACTSAALPSRADGAEHDRR